jgi:hypothetical protein
MNHATYSPEDNKLRLYTSTRLTTEEYSQAKNLGFIWAPKQGCFVKPSWSCQAEDWLIDFTGADIEDEDTSAEDRAADRAERFSVYRDKRIDDATARADRLSDAYSAANERHAARAQRSYDTNRRHALSNWDKAEYWQSRTKGVINNALHKLDAGTRRSRILRLEAEQRKHAKKMEEARAEYFKWENISKIEDEEKQTAAARHAANYMSGWGQYADPRNPENKTSLYSLISSGLSGREAAALYLDAKKHPDTWENAKRWGNHYKLRLAYENQMLEAQGGKAADVEMVISGFIGTHQIHKINRSPATKRVVSVQVMKNGVLRNINIEKAGTSIYRAPTAEELAAYTPPQKEKKETKPLINPTKESAQAYMDYLNEEAQEKYDRYCDKNGYPRSMLEKIPVTEMTQVEYAARSKGSYSNYQTREFGEIKLRTRYAATQFSSQPYSIVVLTDKPQKEINAPVKSIA